MTQHYQVLLKELDLTYPQYLILLILWEEDHLPVTSIGRRLLLTTNTVTPLLKRLEAKGLLTRLRSTQDERKVIVNLTKKGWDLETKALGVPRELSKNLGSDFSPEEALQLKHLLEDLIESMKNSL